MAVTPGSVDQNLAGLYHAVLQIGLMARLKYRADVREGKRTASFVELRELDKNLEAIKRELKEMEQ